MRYRKIPAGDKFRKAGVIYVKYDNEWALLKIGGKLQKYPMQAGEHVEHMGQLQVKTPPIPNVPTEQTRWFDPDRPPAMFLCWYKYRDKDGAIVENHAGMLTGQEMDALVMPLKDAGQLIDWQFSELHDIQSPQEEAAATRRENLERELDALLGEYNAR